jgi:uncharacterized membrane protein
MVGYAVNIFTVPSNGKFLYTTYYVLSAVAMAGINGGTANLLYDYVDVDKRVGATAIQCVVSGLVGFTTTILVSSLVDYIQKNGNVLFGIPVYAQQVVSLIGVIIVAILLLYLNLVVKRITSRREKENMQEAENEARNSQE